MMYKNNAQKLLRIWISNFQIFNWTFMKIFQDHVIAFGRDIIGSCRNMRRRDMHIIMFFFRVLCCYYPSRPIQCGFDKGGIHSLYELVRTIEKIGCSFMGVGRCWGSKAKRVFHPSLILCHSYMHTSLYITEYMIWDWWY